MSTDRKLRAGAAMPEIVLQAVGGGTVTLGGSGRWQAVIVYRGKHCPLCRRYLGRLNALLDSFQADGIDVVAVSSDPLEKAASEKDEEEWRMPVGYGLTSDHMRMLGLYISEPRSPQETDRLFPEPGLFVVNPEGRVQIIDISNAPFARPDLGGVLDGIRLIRERQYPIRGTAG